MEQKERKHVIMLIPLDVVQSEVSYALMVFSIAGFVATKLSAHRAVDHRRGSLLS